MRTPVKMWDIAASSLLRGCMSVMQIQRLSPVLALSRDLKVRVVGGRQLSGSAKQTMQRTICMDISWMYLVRMFGSARGQRRWED